MSTIKYLCTFIFVPFLFIVSAVQGLSNFFKINKQKDLKNLSIVFGSAPLLNNIYWSKSLVQIGLKSETFVFPIFDSISKKDDWDNIITYRYKYFPYPVRIFLAFTESLLKYDIFVLSYRGFFLQKTSLRYFQAQLLKLAQKKIVIIPYGSDAHVYKEIKSTAWAHALMISYPFASRQQHQISKDINYWNKHADVVIPGMMGFDGIGRWDVLAPSSLVLDLNDWNISTRTSTSSVPESDVVLVHSPNHRGCKGTEFIISAVEKLQSEGLKVELKLLERMKNDEVRSILSKEADILVEQIIGTGHGLSALEGMAAGIPTISNLEDETYTLPMRRWSFLNECPLVSATPENITDVLRKLITNPELRSDLGRAGREYVEKYHGLDSAQYLFENVFDYIYGKKDSIINLYHPILGEYPNRIPRIKHPLVQNRIID